MNKKQLINNPNKMVPICYDEMFKAVFGNREYPNITAYLISVLTGIPYSLLKGKIAFKNTNQKLSRVTEKKEETVENPKTGNFTQYGIITVAIIAVGTLGYVSIRKFNKFPQA